MSFSRSFLRGASLLALLFATALRSPAALAEPSTADRAAAETLYEEGRKLFNANQFPEACGKFEESQRLDPGVGTLLYLGSCYEKVGKTASAWITFREAVAAAHTAGQADREKTATQLASALEPKLSKLQLIVPREHELPGLQIRRDGTSLGRALWGSPFPIDPGNHTIEISAPSRKTATLSLVIDKTGQTTSLSIPLLDAAEPAPAASSAAAVPSATVPPTPFSSKDPPPPPAPDRTLALVAGGVGVVGLGLGAYFGVRAIQQWNDAKPLCPADRCNQAGYDQAGSASRSGNLSTIFFTLGAVGVGTGVTLWLLQPSPSSSARRSPSLSVGAAGTSLFARGSW